MKTLYTVISILIFIFIFSISGFFFVSNSKDDIINIIDKIEYDIKQNENKDKIISSIKNLENKWTEKENILTILTRHENLDNIRTNISILIPLLENDEKGVLLAEINKLKTLLNMMVDEESLLFKNLL